VQDKGPPCLKSRSKKPLQVKRLRFSAGASSWPRLQKRTRRIARPNIAMTTHAYTEDQLVEQPAIGLFGVLGWQTVSAMEETFGAGSTLWAARPRARWCWPTACDAALTELNPGVPAEALQRAPSTNSARDRSAHEPGGRQPRGLRAAQGRRSGLGARPASTAGRRPSALRVIDWDDTRTERLPAGQPVQRDGRALHLPAGSGGLRQRPALGGDRVEEARRAGARGLRREPDPLQAADPGSCSSFNALLIASNGTDSRVGSLTADWERFVEWKRIEREDEPRRVSLEVMLRGTCDRARLLDLVENFTLFSQHKAGLVKVLGAEPPVPGREQRHRLDA
jgi:type I restriction enzyme R subunit